MIISEFTQLLSKYSVEIPSKEGKKKKKSRLTPCQGARGDFSIEWGRGVVVDTFGIPSNLPTAGNAVVNAKSQKWRVANWLPRILLYFIVTIFFFVFSGAPPAAYVRSQARGRMGAVAAGLHHSYSRVGSDQCLRSTPQLSATRDT